MMRPRTRAEAASVKVVQPPPPPPTTMREGRRASSGVLAAAGRIYRYSRIEVHSKPVTVCSVRRAGGNATYLPFRRSFPPLSPSLLCSALCVLFFFLLSLFVFVWKKQ